MNDPFKGRRGAKMSRTTDITLLLGNLDDGELDNFNAALLMAGVVFDGDTPTLRSLAPSLNNLPGRRVYTDFIAAACWNYGGGYLPVLVSVFQSYPWGSPENAILVIAGEECSTEITRPRHY